MIWIRIFLLSLVVTLASECFLAWVLGLRTRKEQSLVVLVNLLTNPAVVYLSLLGSRLIGPSGRVWILIGLEAAAVLTEAFIYSRWLDWEELPSGTLAGRLGSARPGWAALVLSLILNAGSYGAGELLEMFL